MQQFRPTAEQIAAAEAVFVTKVFEAKIRPIVEAYEKAILQQHQFRIARRWVEKGCEDRVILDSKDAFLMSEEDAKVWHTACFAARDAAGLKVESPEFCPLLVAEQLRIQAESALLKEMAKESQLSNFDSAFMTMAQRTQAVDLTLRLLARFCSPAPDVLTRVPG